jgi:hypothetical protein
MGVFGNVGREIGAGLGEAGGNWLGGLLGFRKGGLVPGPKGKARKIIAHGGEYILPLGVKPTLAQKKKVANLRKKK